MSSRGYAFDAAAKLPIALFSSAKAAAERLTLVPEPVKAIVVGAALCLCLLGLGGASWTGLSGLTSPFATAAKPALTPQRLTELKRLPAKPGDAAAQALEPIGYDAARMLNAAIPFASSGLGAARPFRFSGTSADRANAVDCLALAAMAEAGGSDAGQRAVIQVVLNRVRHPAFAKTVCGVVFQGSQRRTGCQFTFTCDGSLARRYSDAAWAASKRRAREALGGRVFAAVGAATHYHTDWVHPVWSSALEKIARVDTHLFFRWPGYWGSRAAARIAYRGGETSLASRTRAVAKPATSAPEAGLASIAEGLELAAAGGRVSGVLQLGDAPANVPAASGRIAFRHPAGNAFLVELAPHSAAQSLLAMGRNLCAGKRSCRVLGWADGGAMPAGFPVLPRARDAMSFSYAREAGNAESTRYDCRLFEGAPRDSCLPARAAAPPIEIKLAPALETPPSERNGIRPSSNSG